MDLSGTAAMPGGEQHAAATALVRDVLERVHNIGNAAQADETAEAQGPSVCGVSNLIGDIGHGALAASRAVSRGGTAAKGCNGGRVLVNGSGLLVRWHGLGWSKGLLGLLGGPICALLRRRRLCVLHLRLTLLVLRLDVCVRVLMVDGRLAGHVGGSLGVLVHGDVSLLHFKDM